MIAGPRAHLLVVAGSVLFAAVVASAWLFAVPEEVGLVRAAARGLPPGSLLVVDDVLAEGIAEARAPGSPVVLTASDLERYGPKDARALPCEGPLHVVVKQGAPLPRKLRGLQVDGAPAPLGEDGFVRLRLLRAQR